MPEAIKHQPTEEVSVENDEEMNMWQNNLPDQDISNQDYSDYQDFDDYFSDPIYAEAATKIQRQARVMIARNNFRLSLYKLILLKNILDTKLHKEKMQMLFAFE